MYDEEMKKVCDKYKLNYQFLHFIVAHESNFDADAVGDAGAARGLCQVQRACLQEYNSFNKKSFDFDDMFNPKKNLEVAAWYLSKRIPQMLRFYKKRVDTKNVIIAYNAGIGAVVRSCIPAVTKYYLECARLAGVLERRPAKPFLVVSAIVSLFTFLKKKFFK